MLSPPNLSRFGGPHRTRFFLRGSASQEGGSKEGCEQKAWTSFWACGWGAGLQGLLLHNKALPVLDVLWVWLLVGEGSDRCFVLEMLG